MGEIRRKGVGRSWETENNKGTWKHVKSTIHIYRLGFHFKCES